MRRRKEAEEQRKKGGCKKTGTGPNNIRGVCFVQMNLFHPAIILESMDIVIANGVLHHMHDTKAAFKSISRLVKPSGYIIVGLYNRLGRLWTDFRRTLYKAFGEKALLLDPHLRKDLSPAKRLAWIRDQYRLDQGPIYAPSRTQA